MNKKFKKIFTPTGVKRIFDIVGSLTALIALSPLFLVICIANLLTPNTSVFFSHERRGRKGKPFKIYKFQTMKNNTPNVATGDLENPEQYITRVGRFIRRTSIDELPQFFDVVRGSMSLVGTRPPTLDEYRQYESHHKRRLSMKPGITGLWQVSGRSDIDDFEEVVKLDVQYIDNWSIWMDIYLLFRTVGVVFDRKGAK